ncbi:unnamed protein product, partial [Allacma fusca]
MESFEPDLEDHHDETDQMQNYVRKLVGEMTDLLYKKRSSIAHVVV